MNDNGYDAGHLLLVGHPAATIDIAAGMMRETRAELSVHDASSAALERMRRPGRPLVMVDVAIDLEDILARLRGNRAPGPAEFDALVGRTVADVERALILQTLAHTRGNRTSASTILGISVRTMRNKLRSFIEDGIPVQPAP
jgi:DNA-binding protein Fis